MTRAAAVAAEVAGQSSLVVDGRTGRDRAWPSSDAGVPGAQATPAEPSSAGTGTAAGVLAPAAAAEPVFIFEDRTGRRWHRVKAVAIVLTCLLVVAAVTLLLAALLLAPGRAQSPPAPATTPDQVQAWPNRGAPAQPAISQQGPSPSGEAVPESPATDSAGT